MSNAWDEHQAGVAAAGAAWQEALEALLAAQEKCLDALGQTALAVGESPRSEYGVTALEHGRATQEKVNESVAMIGTIKTSLTDYGSSF